MSLIAELELSDRDGSKIPVYIGVHDCFPVRLVYCRSLQGLEGKGFCRPDSEKPEDEWTVTEAIRMKVEAAFQAGHGLVGIGRAEEGETESDAKEALLAWEKRIAAR